MAFILTLFGSHSHPFTCSGEDGLQGMIVSLRESALAGAYVFSSVLKSILFRNARARNRLHDHSAGYDLAAHIYSPLRVAGECRYGLANVRVTVDSASNHFTDPAGFQSSSPGEPNNSIPTRVA